MRIYFVHGRPAGHPLHAKYGLSIRAKFSVEDPIIRWHDKNYIAPIRYFAWLVNAVAFVKLKRTMVVTEGLRITLVLAKKMSLGKMKLIGLIDDESPYFIVSSYYGALSKRVNIWAYAQYDGFLCIGKMETGLIKQFIIRQPPIRTGFNGVATAWLAKLDKVKYIPDSKRIVFIGNGPSSWRMWYKGLDLMLQVFSDVIEAGHDLYFDVAGDWNANELLKFIEHAPAKLRVRFVGKISEPFSFFQGAGLYLHTARGEAWGITINEAMAAGVVPIVSEWTGAKECVQEVSQALVVPLDRVTIKERVLWFMNLDPEAKLSLSYKCKEVASRYTEVKAVSRFNQMFRELSDQLSAQSS